MKCVQQILEAIFAWKSLSVTEKKWELSATLHYISGLDKQGEGQLFTVLACSSQSSQHTALPSSAIFLNLKLERRCRSTLLVYDHVHFFLEYHFRWWDFQEPAFLVAFLLRNWRLYWKMGEKNDLAPQNTKNLKEKSLLSSSLSKSVRCINTSGTNLLQFLTNKEFLSSCNSFQCSSL